MERMRALDNSSVGAYPSRVKVLYIAGWGRSGSTLLGRILGQVSGFFLVGELRYIWDRGLIENRLCSCGMPFKDCSTWREIVSKAFEDGEPVDTKKLLEVRERGLRTRHVVLARTHKSLQARVSRMGEYPETLGKLYSAVQDIKQSSVIVDTSKFPSYGYVLQNTPGLELYILHLVRDPRAVAYSWASRRKLRMDDENEPNRFMTPHGYIESSLNWGEWNLAIESAWRRKPERYMLMRYEDFVGDPRGSVESILGFLGEEEAGSPFVGEREVSLEVPHTFSGNPDRFRSGTVTVAPDEGWKRNMSSTRQAMVTALTWPG